jgi:exocyst complex component 4
VQKLWLAEEETHNLLEKEVGLLILQTNETPLLLADILLDRKTVASLCLLYTSMKWLANKVDQLRHITTHDVDSSRRNTMRASHNRRWTLLNGSSKAGDGNNAVYLPMTQDTVV